MMIPNDFGVYIFFILRLKPRTKKIGYVNRRTPKWLDSWIGNCHNLPRCFEFYNHILQALFAGNERWLCAKRFRLKSAQVPHPKCFILLSSGGIGTKKAHGERMAPFPSQSCSSCSVKFHGRPAISGLEIHEQTNRHQDIERIHINMNLLNMCFLTAVYSIIFQHVAGFSYCRWTKSCTC